MRQHAKHRKWAVPGNIDLAAHSFLVRLRFGHDHEHNARKVSGHLVTVVPSRAIRPRHLARFMAPLPPTSAGFLWPSVACLLNVEPKGRIQLVNI